MTPYCDLLAKTLTRTLFMPPGVSYDQRAKGLDWPGKGDAETMIGLERLRNIYEVVMDCLATPVPGDLIECGVWRGGATIFMAGVLHENLSKDRNVWVADSFQGCPVGSPDQYPVDRNDPHHTFEFLQVSAAEVRANFARYGLLGPNIKFLEGWFKDTLPEAPIRQIAVLRADGDMYESQTQILEHLYPKVAVGGYVIIDDYYNIHNCRQAVNDYRQKCGITSPMVTVDWCAAYWQKEHE